MSVTQLRSQKWPNVVLKQLEESYGKQSLADVTLVSDEQGEFSAHKIILTSFSPIFRSVLPHNSDHQHVHLQGVRATVLENLLQFMYRGVAYLHQDRIESVLRTAEVLQVGFLPK